MSGDVQGSGSARVGFSEFRKKGLGVIAPFFASSSFFELFFKCRATTAILMICSRRNPGSRASADLF